jgi:hypothetical protein
MVAVPVFVGGASAELKARPLALQLVAVKIIGCNTQQLLQIERFCQPYAGSVFGKGRVWMPAERGCTVPFLRRHTTVVALVLVLVFAAVSLWSNPTIGMKFKHCSF